MKKIILLIFSIFSFVVIPACLVFIISFCIRTNNNPVYYYKNAVKFCNQNYSALSVSNVKYAKVKNNCYLFKTADVSDASYRNVDFVIPSSYFVVVLSDINAYTKRVQYNNRIGYVSSDSVEEVDFIPLEPFLNNITFDVEENVGTQLRKSPIASDASNIITLIPAGTKNITYIASINGVVPTGGNSAVWFYVVYTPAADPTSVYEGYVYSGKTLNLTEIKQNVEGVQVQESIPEEGVFVLNESIKNILIIVISAPIVLVFVLLVVNGRKMKKVKDEKIENGAFKLKEKDGSGVENNLSKIDDFDGVVLKKKKNITMNLFHIRR